MLAGLLTGALARIVATLRTEGGITNGDPARIEGWMRGR